MHEEKLIKEFKQQAKIPGFEQGKHLIVWCSRYAKDLKQELKQRSSPRHQEGVAGADLEVFNIVDMDDGEILSGQAASIILP